jgi:ferredoxin--NADP+ reductase
MTQPVLPDVQMNLVRARDPVSATVVSNELCMRGKSASYVKHLVLDVGDSTLAGAFRAGQSFGVLAPGLDPRGNPYKVRLYSMASPSWGEDGTASMISTTPKRLIEEFVAQDLADDPEDHQLFRGVCSNYLCDVKAGDTVRLTGPNGRRFLLPTDVNAHDYLFLATGTGIAPFRGMLLELLEGKTGPCRSRIDLVMGSPYTTDLLYDDLLKRLDSEHDNFHYHTAISREPRNGQPSGLYVDGYLNEKIDYFGSLLGNSRTTIYLCGLMGVRISLFRMLAEHGLADAYLQIDESLQDRRPDQWSREEIKKSIKPAARCMLEVY